AY
ncbi:hypothetical protein BV195_00040B, partial [Haemophilus influenzae]